MFMNHPDTTGLSPDFTPRACDLTSITSGPFLADWGTLLAPDTPCEVTERKKKCDSVCPVPCMVRLSINSA